jgi:hypothetical protein
MTDSKKPSTLAAPVTFSCYPHEHESLRRIMRERKLKSVFDVVRFLACESHRCGVKPGDFHPPNKKS